MRIIGTKMIDDVLAVATFDGKLYRCTVFGGRLRFPQETCAIKCKNEFCSLWRSDEVPQTFMSIVPLRVLAYFWEDEKAYLTHVNAARVIQGAIYMLCAHADLPDNAKFSEWAERWMTFVSEACARGDRSEDVVDGCRFLSH